MIGGQSDEVASAVGTVRVLDQPRMRGQGSVRIDPMFWSAQELGNKLNEILVSEGYRSAMTATSNTPIILFTGARYQCDHRFCSRPGCSVAHSGLG